MTLEQYAANLPYAVSDATLAKLLDCSRTTIWRRVADGTLKGPVSFGGLSRFIVMDALAPLDDAAKARGEAA